MTNTILVLQKIIKELTKTNDEHTLNFRLIKPIERLQFKIPILITSNSGFTRISVYNLVFNITERNTQVIYASKVSTIAPRAFELADIADIIKQKN